MSNRAHSTVDGHLSPLASLLRPATLLAIGVLTVGLIGCASHGRLNGITQTQVSLGSDNFELMRANVRGESRGFTLLGLIPITSPTFADARDDLYDTAGSSLQGRSVALANLSEDVSSTFMLIGSIERITLTADIVEFHE